MQGWMDYLHLGGSRSWKSPEHSGTGTGLWEGDHEVTSRGSLSHGVYPQPSALRAARTVPPPSPWVMDRQR
jgi:hypothetical protein